MTIPGQSIRNAVFEVVNMRMKSLGLNTQGFTFDRINFLKKIQGDEDDNLLNDTCYTMNTNYNISDDELSTIIALTECTEINDKLIALINEQHKIYFHNKCYIKSFTITPEILVQLANNWSELGLFPTVTNMWYTFLSNYPGKTFYYRYVGQTSIAGSIRNKSSFTTRKHGFIHCFFNSIKEISGGEDWINNNCRHFFVEPFHPYVSRDSRNENYNLWDQKSLDEQEQMLISFFGIENLLNIQTGGVNASYNPGVEAFKLYRSLPTTQNFFRSYQELTRNSPQQLKNNLLEWLSTVSSEFTKHCTGANSNNLMTTRQLELIYAQATPKVVDNNGNVIFVCISSIIPKKAFLENCSFLSPATHQQSGIVICDHLSRLESYQNGSSTWNINSYADSFPFLNITPWLTSNKLSEALQEGCYQMNKYLRIARPLITMSISKASTKFAFSDFIHPHGFIRDRSYIKEVVGVPRRVLINDITLLEDKNVLEMPQDCSTIVIPHIHPGMDAHSARDITCSREIMDLTWQITLFIAELAMVLSTQAGPRTPREALIEEIMNRCLPDSPQLDPSMQVLYQRLFQAKNNYQQAEDDRNKTNNRIIATIHTKENPNPRYFNKTPQLKHGRLQRLGQSVGLPHSDKRRERADLLWKMNIPELHCCFSRNQKQEWYKWIMEMREDKNILASTLHESSVAGKPSRNYATLKRFRPEGVEESNDDWMQIEELVAAANQRWNISIAPHVPEGHFSSEAQSKRRCDHLNSTYLETIEGTVYYAHKQGYVMLFWRTPEEEKCKFKIYLNFLKHKQEGRDMRCKVNFVDNGIQVTKEDNTKGLYNIQNINGNSNGIKLLQLWGSERYKITGQVPQDAQRTRPSVPPGRNMMKVCNKSLEEYGPIQENDSVYILQCYLDTFFPEGGKLCFGQPEYYSALENRGLPYVYSTFIDSYYEYLQNGQHADHPLISEHLSWIQNPKYIRYFMENLKLLRTDIYDMTEMVKVDGKVKRIKMISFR